MNKHKSVKGMLPAGLKNLDWRQIGELKLEDGDRLLVAVPVCWTAEPHPKRRTPNGRDWYYEINVVVIDCDEHYSRVETVDGQSWGWELSDVDFAVKITSPDRFQGSRKEHYTVAECENCKKDTSHVYYCEGHERDSSHDYRRCLACGWIKFDHDDHYQPPIS